MILLGFHLRHGFQSAFKTLGMQNSKFDKIKTDLILSQKKYSSEILLLSKKLKPVDPKKQKGLSRLPRAVRNKMGYMKSGGRA